MNDTDGGRVRYGLVCLLLSILEILYELLCNQLGDSLLQEVVSNPAIVIRSETKSETEEKPIGPMQM
jgi:hypothetical protein